MKAWFTGPLKISAVCNDLQLLTYLKLPFRKLNRKNFLATLVSSTRKCCAGFVRQSGQLVHKMAYGGTHDKGRDESKGVIVYQITITNKNLEDFVSARS